MYVYLTQKRKAKRFKMATKSTRKQLAGEIYDLYNRKWQQFGNSKKSAWVRHLLNGDLGTGYKSIEELAYWRDRLLAEAA